MFYKGCWITKIGKNSSFFVASQIFNVSLINSSFSDFDDFTENLNNFFYINNIYIENCRFSNLSIGGYLIATYFSNLMIIQCVFLNITLKNQNSNKVIAFIRVGASLEMTNSYFTNNYIINASIFFIQNDFVLMETKIKIENVIFLSNSLKNGDCLAVYIIGYNINTFLNNVQFQNNFSPQSLIFITNTLNFVTFNGLTLNGNFGYNLINLNLVK